MASSPSPTVRRRRLLRELQQLRARSGKTIDQAAAFTGMSKSTLSRIESGQVGLKTVMLRGLLDFYDASESQRQALLKLHREASQRGWWQDFDVPVSEAHRMLAGLEDEASSLGVFQAAMVPGLLQTPEYAVAVMKGYRPDATAEYLESGIAFRQRRQERIGEFDLVVILAEEVLLRQVGGPEVMRSQLEQILELAALPRTAVRVIPLIVGSYAGIAGSFSILDFQHPDDPAVVYLEGAAGERYVEDSGAVGQFKDRFARLEEIGLSTERSINLIRQLTKGPPDV